MNRSSPTRPRVLILTAAMGSGHRQVAGELGRRLTRAGAACTTFDLVLDTGAAGRHLQGTYRALLRRAPWVYDGAMRFWARWPAPMERFTAANARPFEAAIAHRLRTAGPDVIVSTYNLASQCLGRLRAAGGVPQPVVTVVIDPGAHPYWVSRNVDRHLVPLPETAAAVGRYGARGVAVTAPALRAEMCRPASRSAARLALGLGKDERVVLVSGGSWAAGHVARTAGLLAKGTPFTVIVLCGHDTRLFERLRRAPRTIPVPWTRQVVTYLAAADVVVDNAGGLTCWESLALKRPVVLFDPLPGHGRLNARTLHSAGLATWARSDDELITAASTSWPPRTPPEGLDPAGEILAAAGARC